jgi:hypothetical protein
MFDKKVNEGLGKSLDICGSYVGINGCWAEGFADFGPLSQGSY